jgi:hypothetical protein
LIVILVNLFLVLNKEDPDWYWIVRTDGQEGFVPSAFVYPAENILQNQDALAATNGTSTATALNNINNNGAAGGNLMSLSNNTQLNTTNNVNNFMPANNINQLQPISQEPAQMLTNAHDDSRYHGTELVMLYDYKAQAPDDLSVRRGELIYADLNNQTVCGWIWAYAPKAQKKCGKYGFIPKAYTQPYRQNTSV